MNKQPLGALYEFPLKVCIQAKRVWVVGFMGMLATAFCYAQQPCVQGMRIDGAITDPTGAVIPGARVQRSYGPVRC